MFPISRQSNTPAADSPAAEAAQASRTTRTGILQIDAVTRNAAAQALRSMDFLDGLMQHIALGLISTRPGWPPGVQIQLHIDGSPPGAPALRYGLPARPDPCGLVDILQCADGQYAALDTSAPHAPWVYCGAQPNSLFEALRLGLRLRDPTAFDNFTQACRHDTPRRGEDAALLRHCLADQLERSCDLSEFVLRALDAYGQQQQAALQRAQPGQPGHPRPSVRPPPPMQVPGVSVAATAEPVVKHARAEETLPDAGQPPSARSASYSSARAATIAMDIPDAASSDALDPVRQEGLHILAGWIRESIDDSPPAKIARLSRPTDVPAGIAPETQATLAAIREAMPRRDGEANLAYARRLREQQPGLSLSELSLLSGAMESQLRSEPAFQALSVALAAIRDAMPRRDGEANLAYARRLHEQPGLSMS
jgi:hypothetical protein